MPPTHRCETATERAERIEKIRRRLVGASYDSDRKLREAVARLLSELGDRPER